MRLNVYMPVFLLNYGLEKHKPSFVVSYPHSVVLVLPLLTITLTSLWSRVKTFSKDSFSTLNACTCFFRLRFCCKRSEFCIVSGLASGLGVLSIKLRLNELWVFFGVSLACVDTMAVVLLYNLWSCRLNAPADLPNGLCSGWGNFLSGEWYLLFFLGCRRTLDPLPVN